MANTSLPDLTQRTTTASGDLIHVNSGGTDYKQTKASFTSDLAKEISFSTSSTLTSQVDALSVGGYYGFIASYGHQTATGMPYDVNFFVTVQKYDSNNCTVHAIARGTNPRKWTINKANSWGSWIEDPSRDEISALNNSLTKSFACDLLFDNKSIPSTATSYECNWGDYHFILICTMFYGNVRSTYLIPYAIMYGSTSNSRPQAYDPYSNIRYDIYANGFGRVYALTAQGTSDSTLGLRIYGVYKR